MKLRTLLAQFSNTRPQRSIGRKSRKKNLSTPQEVRAVERLEERVLLSSVTGIVFEDGAGDGVNDPTDRELSGFPVSAWNVGNDNLFGTADDQFVAATRTNAAGHYTFTLMTAANYVVRFGGQIGAWQFSTSPLNSQQSDGSDVNSGGVSAQFAAGGTAADVTMDAGIQPVSSDLVRARIVQQTYALTKTHPTYLLNFFGQNEKWLKGQYGGKSEWYFLTPSGDLYNWDSGVRQTTGEYIASLGTAVYTNPALLHNALGNIETTGIGSQQLAYDLDTQLHLAAGGTEFGNWYETYGGQGVRWVAGDLNQHGNRWYFIRPDGAVHAWDGTLQVASGAFLAQLGPEYFQTPTLFTNAVRPVSGGDVLGPTKEAFGITKTTTRPGLVTTGSGVWYLGSTNQFGNKQYFLTSDGKLSAWNGKSSQTGVVVAQLPTYVHSVPGALIAAQPFIDESSSEAAAYDLNRHYNLTSPGHYIDNWGGQNEKWIKGTTADNATVWLIILPTGEVRKADSWTRSPRSITSTHLADLSPVYYQFPRLLHNALPNIAFESSVGGSDRTSPTITLDDLNTTIISNGNVSVSGRVTDNASGVESLLAQVDLADAASVTFAADGRFTFTTSASLTGSSDGQHVIRLRATDRAGNVSDLTTINWTLDTIAPTVTSTADGTLRDQIDAITLGFSEAVSDDALDATNYSVEITSGPDAGDIILPSAVVQNFETSIRIEFASPLLNQAYRLIISPSVTDLTGNPLTQAQFDFSIAQPTAIAELSPAAGEEMVSLTRETIVRFDTEVDPATITDQSFYLLANSLRVPGHIRVSSTNRFATFFYDDPLPASTAVRVVVDGNLIVGQDGLPVDADGDSEPGGVVNADFRTLPITLIPNTRIFGYVYDSYNRNTDGSNIPVVGATISLDARPDIKAITDATGFFELGIQDVNGDTVPDGLPAPEFFVHIDGSTATNAPAGAAYATLGKPFHTSPGQRVQLEMAGGPDVDPTTPGEQFHIFLPPMSMGDVVTLNPNADTVVGFGPDAQAQIRRMMDERYPTDPATAAEQAQLIIDTMQVTYPAGSAMNEEGTLATRATIVPVDPSRLPAPLPPGANPGIVISVQAGTEAGFNLAGGSTNFDVAAPAVFPNTEGLAPGEKSLIMSFDHDAGKWTVIGTGTVSEDAKQIVTDTDTGILAPGWHFVIRGTPAAFQIGIRSSDSKNPLMGGDDFLHRSNGLITRIDNAFNDLLLGVPELLESLPDLGFISLLPDLRANPVERRLQSVARRFVELGSLAFGADQELASRYYEHFLEGTGTPIENDSETIRLIKASRKFQEFFENAAARLLPFISKAVEDTVDPQAGTLDLEEVAETIKTRLSNYEPWPSNVVLDDDGTLRLIIDNTQGIEIVLENLGATSVGSYSSESGGMGEWCGEMRISLFDDFGFDGQDISRTYEEAIKTLATIPDDLHKASEAFVQAGLAIELNDFSTAYVEAGRFIDRLNDAATALTSVAINLGGASGVAVLRLLQVEGSARPFVVRADISNDKDETFLQVGGEFDIPPGFDNVIQTGRGCPENSADEGKLNAARANQNLSSAVISNTNGFGSRNDVFFRIDLAGGTPIYGSVANGQSIHDLVLSPEMDYVATFYAPAINSHSTLTGTTSLSGTLTSVVRSPLDLANPIQRLHLHNFGGLDQDGDGIPDLGEFAMGTNSNHVDTDLDGISDSAEIEQGLNPLDGIAVNTGVLSTLRLPGAKSVAAEGSTLYIVRDNAVSIVDASRFDRPIRLGDLPISSASAISIDPQRKLLAVLNSDGLSIVDVADAMFPETIRQIPVRGSVMTAVDGIAYVAGDRRITAIDMLTGEILQELELPASVVQIAFDRGHLFATTIANTLLSIEIGRFGILQLADSFTITTGSVSGAQLRLGDGAAWIMGSAFTSIDISNPKAMTLLNSGSLGAQSNGAALTGSGKAVFLTGNRNVEVRSIDVGNMVGPIIATHFVSPGVRDIVISGGMAYVTTDFGLEVVNYQAFDISGIAPSISLAHDGTDEDPERAGIQVTLGTPLTVHATVQDNVQVARVDFYRDTDFVFSDYDFPFNFSTSAAGNIAGSMSTLSAIAIDTGGNRSTAAAVDFEILPDLVNPEILEFVAGDPSRPYEPPRSARLQFSEPIVVVDAEENGPPSTTITGKGKDGIWGSTDDFTVSHHVMLRDRDRQMQLIFDEAILPGEYKLSLVGSQFRDRSGNALAANSFEYEFTVSNTPFNTYVNVQAESDQLHRLVFAGQAGDVVTIVADPKTNRFQIHSLDLTLVSSSGQIVASAVAYSTERGYSVLNHITLPADDNYTVVVRQAGQSSSTRQIVLSISDPETDVEVLLPGSTFSSAFAVPGDDRELVFDGEAGEIITLQLTGTLIYSDTGKQRFFDAFEITVPDGSLLYSVAAGEKWILPALQLPVSGRYRFVLSTTRPFGNSHHEDFTITSTKFATTNSVVAPFTEGFDSTSLGPHWTQEGTAGTGNIPFGTTELSLSKSGSDAIGPDRASATLWVNLAVADPQQDILLQLNHKHVQRTTSSGPFGTFNTVNETMNPRAIMPVTFNERVLGEGLAISDDGLNWHRVLDLSAFSADYQLSTINLSALARTFGLNTTRPIRVLFQSNASSYSRSTSTGPFGTTTEIRSELTIFDSIVLSLVDKV